MPEPKQPEPVIEADLGKVCPECGNLFRGKSKFCSTVCYNRDWRERNPSKKPHKRKAVIPLPNQAKVNENLTAEQARIEAVVAKAKLDAPGANFEHQIVGPILARKL
jgi:hypothetical protein